MKKYLNGILFVTILFMVITWIAVGINIVNGNYEAVTPGACIVLACLIVNLACNLYRHFSNKCPHCGRMNTGSGEYCSHCGKKKN